MTAWWFSLSWTERMAVLLTVCAIAFFLLAVVYAMVYVLTAGRRRQDAAEVDALRARTATPPPAQLPA